MIGGSSRFCSSKVACRIREPSSDRPQMTRMPRWIIHARGAVDSPIQYPSLPSPPLSNIPTLPFQDNTAQKCPKRGTSSGQKNTVPHCPTRSRRLLLLPCALRAGKSRHSSRAAVSRTGDNEKDGEQKSPRKRVSLASATFRRCAPSDAGRTFRSGSSVPGGGHR